MNKPASLALTPLLLCIPPGAARLHAAPAAAPGEAYYTEEQIHFGSAKIFAQMGKAFAEALLPFQK